ncbi:MAG: CRISPR-associated endonuclease Cas1 [Saprospiraceae bacterium]
MQLVLDTHGLKISVQKGTFLVEGEGGKRRISPRMIDSIAVHAHVLLSSAVVELAIASNIPLLFFDGIGNPLGRTWSLRFESHPLIRRNQVLFERDLEKAQPWIIGLYKLKTQRQLANLKDCKTESLREREQVEQWMNQLDSIKLKPGDDFEAVVMGLEGAAAKAYWKALSDMMPAPFTFDGRSRQPALDHFNCLLNYGYGMLYNTVEGAIFSAGLDPYLGIVHRDNYNRPSLTFDLIEPFRPWVDNMVADLCLNGLVSPSSFDPVEGGGWTLNKPGKQIVIPAFHACMNEKIELYRRTMTRKNHIYQYAGEFASMLKDLKF